MQTNTQKMFFAGYGGQGVLMIGQILTYAAMHEDKEVTFMPAYGPEMRGGTANCTVVISNRPISCPVIYEADLVVAMNPPSLLKYAGLAKQNGSVFVNSSLVKEQPQRSDILFHAVPANDIALELNNSRSANIVMLGAINRSLQIVEDASIEWALKNKVFTGRKAKLFDLNWQAYLAWPTERQPLYPTAEPGLMQAAHHSSPARQALLA